MSLSAPELLDARHQVSDFSCGKPSLDHWLKNYALSNQRHGFTVVMVVHRQQRVLGYYGLAPTAVEPKSLPRKTRTGQPPRSIPCLLLGQLAVDQSMSGQGLGAALLAHALERAVAGAQLIGGRAVLVQAIDESALTFWRAHGFEPTRDEPMLLSRSIADIAASLQAATRR